MDKARIIQISETIASVGYDGIIEFDREEPEYKAFKTLSRNIGDPPHRALLGICAGTVDYQLAGDAQQFWMELERTALEHGHLDSVNDVKRILGTFMDTSVNARLNQQKRRRLIKLFENGFTDWFIDTYDTVAPLHVWENIADALNTQMDKKTIVFSMKVYDIISFIETGSYLDFPSDVPIPCDLQVKRVAQTAGIVDTKSESDVMSAWSDVAEQVSRELGRNVSLLRIDSIVWQAGQIIGKHEPNRTASREALVKHFETVGLSSAESRELAYELTAAM